MNIIRTLNNRISMCQKFAPSLWRECPKKSGHIFRCWWIHWRFVGGVWGWCGLIRTTWLIGCCCWVNWLLSAFATSPAASISIAFSQTHHSVRFGRYIQAKLCIYGALRHRGAQVQHWAYIHAGGAKHTRHETRHTTPVYVAVSRALLFFCSFIITVLKTLYIYQQPTTLFWRQGQQKESASNRSQW